MPTKRARPSRATRASARPARAGAPRVGLDRTLVLDVARQLADRDGMGALTLRAVAEHFGVKPPSIYNHIDGLDEIKRALALEGMRQLGQRFARASAGLARDDAVRALARVYRRFAHEHPGLYQAALAAPDPSDSEASAAATEAAEIIFAVLAGYGLAHDEQVHATRALRAAMHGFVALEHVGGFGLPLDVERSYERAIEWFIAGLNAPAA